MKRSALAVLFLLLVCGSALAQGYRGHDPSGSASPQNAVCEQDQTLRLSLYLTSENRAMGTITNFFDSAENQHFTIESGSSIERDIDTEIELDSSGEWQHNVLHITTDEDISVYVVTHRRNCTDSYMAIPTELLGKEYVAAGYAAVKNSDEFFTSQATIIGTEDNTFVTIHLAAATKNGFPKGRTLMVPLHRGETFQLQGTQNGDLTGTTVSANEPIAFFTGHTCTQAPPKVTFCNTLLEMEPPANDWGTSFILTAFEGRNFYAARVIANADSTEISINGVKVRTIDRGEFYEVDTFHHNAIVTTSKPALVAQYCTSSGGDRARMVDPFMLIAVPDDRFITEATTSSVIQGPYKDYVNIVAPDSAESTLRVDGGGGGNGNVPGRSDAGAQKPYSQRCKYVCSAYLTSCRRTPLSAVRCANRRV